MLFHWLGGKTLVCESCFKRFESWLFLLNSASSYTIWQIYCLDCVVYMVHLKEKPEVNVSRVEIPICPIIDFYLDFFYLYFWIIRNHDNPNHDIKSWLDNWAWTNPMFQSRKIIFSSEQWTNGQMDRRICSIYMVIVRKTILHKNLIQIPRGHAQHCQSNPKYLSSIDVSHSLTH